MWKRSVLAGVAVMGLIGAGPVWAQERSADQPATTFEQLSTVVKAGQALEVVQQDGTRMRGQLAALQGGSMTLTVKGTARTFQESSVRKVRRTDSVGNGVAIGALTGGALAALGVASTRGTSDAFYGYAYIGSWLFPAIGAVVGWAIDRHEGHGIVFEPSRAQAFSLGPDVAAHRVGVSGTFRF